MYPQHNTLPSLVVIRRAQVEKEMARSSCSMLCNNVVIVVVVSLWHQGAIDNFQLYPMQTYTVPLLCWFLPKAAAAASFWCLLHLELARFFQLFSRHLISQCFGCFHAHTHTHTGAILTTTLPLLSLNQKAFPKYT